MGESPARRGVSLTTYRALLVLVSLLTMFGLVMVLSSSSVEAVGEGASSWSYFSRQLMWTGIALIVGVVTLGVDYRLWRRLALVSVLITVMLLVAVDLVGNTAGGSQRWLVFGPISFQPSELAKLSMLLFSADLLQRRQHRIADHRRSMNTILLVLALVTALVLSQPDLGTTIIIATITFSVMFVAGVPLKPLGVAGAAGLVAAVSLALIEPYRRARMTGFIDPWADPLGTGYQTLQSLVGLASGGIDGRGLGESRAKWGFLPNAHTDFIFAIVGEELGLIGGLTIMASFLVLGWLGIHVAMRAPDLFGTLMAAGITTWLMMQVFVNVGGVVGVLPITGVTLPFVSFGGSALVLNMAAVGILGNIARQARRG